LRFSYEVSKGLDKELEKLQKKNKKRFDIILKKMGEIINDLVCGSCGEKYYNRQTMKKLEDIKEKLCRKTIKLDVIGSVLRFPDKISNVLVS
jgi:hypothetical protein